MAVQYIMLCAADTAIAAFKGNIYTWIHITSMICSKCVFVNMENTFELLLVNSYC